MEHPKDIISKKYPKYIIFSWLIIWIVVFLFTTISSIFSLTPDGKYIEKKHCLDTGSSMRYGENEFCEEYSEPYYFAAGEYIRSEFFGTGYRAAILVFAVGSIAIYIVRKKENNNETNNRDLVIVVGFLIILFLGLFVFQDSLLPESPNAIMKLPN